MAIYQLSFSPTGGTKKVMELLTEEWPEEKHVYDLSNAECRKATLQKEDICFVGAPVFGGRVPKKALENLKTMTANGAYAVPVAVYGGRAIDDALLELADTLTEMGFRCCAAIAAVAEHSLLHIYAQGRPNDEDKRDLHTMSKKLRKLYRAGKLPQCVEVPGNRPYLVTSTMPIYPVGNDQCIQCGKCGKNCPSDAIQAPDFRQTDPALCIRCMRCVAQCPTHARDLDPAFIKATQVKMKERFGEEKHNELFLLEIK